MNTSLSPGPSRAGDSSRCVSDTAEVWFEEGSQASCALLPLAMLDLLGQTGGAVLQGALPAAHAYSGSANPRVPCVRADGHLAGWPQSEPLGPGHLHLPSSNCYRVGILVPCSCLWLGYFGTQDGAYLH